MNSTQLLKHITYMVQNGDYVAGHAIFKGRDVKASQIITEGLIIQDSSRGIPSTAREFSPDFEDNLLNLNDLFSVSEEVIIISIPKELLKNYESRHFESYDSSSIVLEDTGQYSSDYKDTYGKPTKIARLPSIYILGYLSAQEDIFIYNSDYAFDVHKRVISVSKLMPNLEQKYKRILELKREINNGNGHLEDIER